MPATTRYGRTDGCWTCKLRRKKCDERRPTCGTCDSLEVDCTYGPKPAWMYSGRQQRQMAEVLKNNIKRNAAYRREKVKSSSGVAHDATAHNFNVIPHTLVSNSLSSIEPTDDAISGDQTSTSASDVSASRGPAPFNLLPCGHQQHRCSSSMEQPSVIEIDFIMKYFDFVFPVLFPFYRPGLFETGRTWLLLLLGKSKIAFHSTLSLSSYFFTRALAEADSGKEYAGCNQL